MFGELINRRRHVIYRNGVKYYRCYVCEGVVLYKDRYSHSVTCFDNKGIKFPIRDLDVRSHVSNASTRAVRSYLLGENEPSIPAGRSGGRRQGSKRARNE